MAKIITLPGSGAWQERYDVFTIVLDPERFATTNRPFWTP